MGQHLPSRAIRRFMLNITVCEPIGDWDDCRIRVAASILSEHFGCNVQGELISTLYGSDRRGGMMLLENAQRAPKTRRPGLLSTRICAGELEVMRFEVVALPIYAYDGITQWCLVGTFRL